MRKWKPNFRAFEASFNSVVVWGKVSRFCIQVNIEDPLRWFIVIQGRKQMLQYEGIDKVCFSCGRIGHRRESCLISYPNLTMGTKDNLVESHKNPAARSLKEGKGMLNIKANNSVKANVSPSEEDALR
ncbi:hypothetical protein Golax_021571 [Gossypium laxum]|uniref:CCHC-type domain-containing protein n=1 Tax=Gossypium laxum TaxID=34288 RepID=A0A7J9ALW2_9ROSI|nr:hypothetical protein [Gossypium laxum]